MGSITTVILYQILLFLGALALIVFYQMLTGRINMRRLLFAKGRAAAGDLSPSRIQLLIVSIGVAIYLLAEVLRDPSQFPEIPTGLLLLMASSEAIYLARKANYLFIRSYRSRNSQT